MKKRYFKKNNDGQVLGLPMYLIIVMIVAVAVIAAVIFMIPKGAQTMNAQVTGGSLISLTGDGKLSGVAASNDVVVSVTTNDDRADPVSGATVTLTGAGVALEAKTNADGTWTFPAATVIPILEANQNTAYIKLTVKASGFEDFEDDTAVTVVRTQTP